MLQLNFSTAEELIFWNKDIQQLLPNHMFSIFEQWRLAQQHSFLRDMGKQAILDFLNALTEDDISILEDYFSQRIIVEKLNYNIALNFKVPLSQDKLCNELCNLEGFNYLSLYRDDEHMYITAWR